MAAKAGVAYRVLTGLSYPSHGRGRERRAEPGDVVDDIPTKSVQWLVEQGHIEPVKNGGA